MACELANVSPFFKNPFAYHRNTIQVQGRKHPQKIDILNHNEEVKNNE